MHHSTDHRPELQPVANTNRRRGMTLVEVTVVIAVLLGLISVLMVGVTAYRKGSNRAICIQNIGTVQKAVRSYGNLYSLFPGDTWPGLQDEVIGSNKFIEAVNPCPGQGSYSFAGDTIPAVGSLYMNCSISEHLPPNAATW